MPPPSQGAVPSCSSSEDDDITAQKAKARREMQEYNDKKSCRSTPSEPYVPFFQQHKIHNSPQRRQPTGHPNCHPTGHPNGHPTGHPTGQPVPPLPAPRKHKDYPPKDAQVDMTGMLGTCVLSS